MSLHQLRRGHAPACDFRSEILVAAEPRTPVLRCHLDHQQTEAGDKEEGGKSKQ